MVECGTAQIKPSPGKLGKTRYNLVLASTNQPRLLEKPSKTRYNLV